MEIGLVFFHGWGFDSRFWHKISGLLSIFPSIYVDKDYFCEYSTPPTIKSIESAPDFYARKWIAICHSYGLAYLTQSLLKNQQLQDYILGIISIAGFLRFTKSDGQSTGIDAPILHKMIRKFERSPLIVLQDFYQQCQFKEDDHLKRGQELSPHLLADLKDLLIVNEETTFQKLGKPFLILASEDDLIVSQHTARQMHQNCPSSQIILRKDGGHALGFNKAEWCAEKINEFIKKRAS